MKLRIALLGTVVLLAGSVLAVGQEDIKHTEVLNAILKNGPPFSKPFAPTQGRVLDDSDKIRIESFVAQPALLANTEQQTRVTLTIKNLHSAAITGVPWIIWKNGTSAPSMRGVSPTIAPGAVWSPTPIAVPVEVGTTSLMASIELPSPLFEKFFYRVNNSQEIVVTRAGPGLRRVLLEGHLARAARASFTVVPQTIAGKEVPFNGRLRQWLDGNDDSWTLHNATPSAYFRLICNGVPPSGCTAGAEAFGGFTLKNGYKVVDVQWDSTNAGAGSGYFSIERQPGIGTNDPHTTINVTGRFRANFEVWLAIWVEGPADMSPYTEGEKIPVK